MGSPGATRAEMGTMHSPRSGGGPAGSELLEATSRIVAEQLETTTLVNI